MNTSRSAVTRTAAAGVAEHGMTLAEVLAAVAIIAIIAAIALPSYGEFMERARRSEGRAALAEVAARQERFYQDNKVYAASLADLSVADATTEHGYYALSIPVATSLTYTIRATAAGGQSGDTDCPQLEIDWLNRRTPPDCW